MTPRRKRCYKVSIVKSCLGSEIKSNLQRTRTTPLFIHVKAQTFSTIISAHHLHFVVYAMKRTRNKSDQMTAAKPETLIIKLEEAYMNRSIPSLQTCLPHDSIITNSYILLGILIPPSSLSTTPFSIMFSILCVTS